MLHFCRLCTIVITNRNAYDLMFVGAGSHDHSYSVGPCHCQRQSLFNKINKSRVLYVEIRALMALEVLVSAPLNVIQVV